MCTEFVAVERWLGENGITAVTVVGHTPLLSAELNPMLSLLSFNAEELHRQPAWVYAAEHVCPVRV